jgi:hypothetical protein
VVSGRFRKTAIVVCFIDGHSVLTHVGSIVARMFTLGTGCIRMLCFMPWSLYPWHPVDRSQSQLAESHSERATGMLWMGP